jgi:hypothetical protein
MITEQIAARLQDALARERSAIVALDTPSLPAIEAEKAALLDDLKQRLSGPDEARRLLGPIFIEAEINALLLKQAVGTMASLLGITETGVYDRSARTSKSTASAKRRVA